LAGKGVKIRKLQRTEQQSDHLEDEESETRSNRETMQNKAQKSRGESVRGRTDSRRHEDLECH